MHLVVAGHDLDSLDETLVPVQRTASSGVAVIEQTSLRIEMEALSTGKRGVIALWNYPPEMSRQHRQRRFYLD